MVLCVVGALLWGLLFAALYVAYVLVTTVGAIA